MKKDRRKLDSGVRPKGVEPSPGGLILNHKKLNLVHVTHEAVLKIGGIGSVLEGLITSPDYASCVDRTILLAPLFSTEGQADARLGPQGEVLYSSLDKRCDHPLAGKFLDIQRHFGVQIVYGFRMLHEPLTGRQQRCEVVLIEVGQAAAKPVNAFKRNLFESYGIDSARYEHLWDYEMYIRLAEPGLAAVSALGAISDTSDCVIVGHEYMGLPTALAAKLQRRQGLKAVYHAHEVCTVRKIVEEHPGHDTMFYNVQKIANKEGLFLDDLFGDHDDFYRHALVEASRHLDMTLAVGDYVVDELRFLNASMSDSNIRLVYNGIPVLEIDPHESVLSKQRLQDYAHTLLGVRPDYIFTHVTRMSTSKGLWRDIQVMNEIEQAFGSSGETAVLFVLSTETGGPRPSADILHMERWWDWPVAHREVPPDLSGGEALYYQGVQGFNARSRQCKIVFINQFGFTRRRCGERMPADMAFWDIRRGSDVEFGQSIYEPFGIAQIEALSCGAICLVSSICGCRFFAEHVAGEQSCPNLIVADYTDYLPQALALDDYKLLSRQARETFEQTVAQQMARRIVERLPRTAKQKTDRIHTGNDLAQRMSWDVVARDYFLPALREILAVCCTH